MTIQSYPKHEKHNWTHSFHGNISHTIFDSEGNSYQVGYFNTLTNFVDGTSLNANYTPNISYSDAYVIKLDDNGELLWSKIISGEKSQYLNRLLFSSDGNIIALGYTEDIAILSNGEELGNEDSNTNRDFLVKFDSSSGDILWATLTEDGDYDVASAFYRNAVLSNGDILFFTYYNYHWDINNNDINIFKLNSSNGEVTTVEYNGTIPARIQAVEVDDNDNIYVGSQIEDGTSGYFYTSSLIKYDSNLNILWNMTNMGLTRL